MFSTIVSTIKTQKEEVAEEVKSALLRQYWCTCEVMNVSCARKGSSEELLCAGPYAAKAIITCGRSFTKILREDR